MPTAADYLEQLKTLLPPGQAFPREAGTTLHKLLEGMSIELARVDGRGEALPLEANPASTNELLSDWERVAGLPDKCSGALEETLQGRRNALLAKLASTGGQSLQYFISIAAALGYDVTITEFRPFRVGMSKVGDSLTNGDWQFTWQVNGPETTVLAFRVGLSAVGEPLRSWGTSSLECKIRQLAPAHTIPIFSYANSSLDLNFALDTYLVKQQSVPFASIINFTRATIRTRYNAAKDIEQLASGAAGISFSPVSGAREGLLVETPSTNGYTQSQDLSNAVWGKNEGSISSAGTIKGIPFFKFTLSSNSAVHSITRALALTAASTVTLSWHAKAEVYQRLSVRVAPGGVLLGRVVFDVLTGEITQNAVGIQSSIIPVGDGVYRISVTFAMGAGVTAAGANLEIADITNSVTFAGDGIGGILIGGPQGEESDYPSTYIPTTTTTVTRNADVPITEMLLPWLGQAAGTFVIDFRTDAPLSNVAATRRHLFTLRTGNEQLIVYLQTGGVGTVTRTTAGGIVTQGVFGGNITAGKIAIAFDGTNLTTAVAGAVRTVPATLNVAAMTTLSIGTQGTDNTRQLNGVVRSLRYYPRRVSDADLIALTLS
ncbi:putative phage tail protein [Pseudomonas moorei]|uniref:YmfQ family protein n=1 Tax=Pseudomonas moorei TaxID=395599 RepID=UPI0036F385F2